MGKLKVNTIKDILDAIKDYYYALDTGQHGGEAQNKAFEKIQVILGMHWIRGDEKWRRENLYPETNNEEEVGTMRRIRSTIEEIHDLAVYLEGMADGAKILGNPHGKLESAAQWLHKLSENICGAGIIGCTGGRECDSDHK